MDRAFSQGVWDPRDQRAVVGGAVRVTRVYADVSGARPGPVQPGEGRRAGDDSVPPGGVRVPAGGGGGVHGASPGPVPDRGGEAGGGPLVKALGAKMELGPRGDYFVVKRGADRIFYSPCCVDALVNGKMVRMEAGPQLAG